VDGGTTNTFVYNSRGLRASGSATEFFFGLNGEIVSAITPGTTTLLYNLPTVIARIAI
jgi:hypothetical protein